jgi:nicotinate-nucleotide pyrophosphorylase (carboxylating)
VSLIQQSWRELIPTYLKEDGLLDHVHYLKSLPQGQVKCTLKLKSDLVLCGLDAFSEVFNYLGNTEFNWTFRQQEGHFFTKDSQTSFEFALPFSVALSGERIALNLLSRASAVATYTSQFVRLAKPHGIEILDTRKTTPGFKAFEKYAVTVGGGKNHRFGSTEILMIKDNHKKVYGGLEPAVKAMRDMAGFYSPLIVEIHDLEELKQAKKLKLKHLMLDNFAPLAVKEAVTLKAEDMTYEISGGINLNTISNYLLPGVDAISIGGLTHNPPPVDMSLKMGPL